MEINDILVIDAKADTWKEAILQSGTKLLNEKYVKEVFAQECIKREYEYPTGLPTATPIAIPQCASEFVNKEALCVLRLEKPVQFHRMDDFDSYVDVPVVFNLALKKDDEHIVFLQKFINALSNENADFVKEIMDAKISEVGQIFKKFDIL